MSIRTLAGQYFNLLSRAAALTSSTLDPLYLPPGGPGLPGLADGRTSRLVKFGTFVGGENVVVDGNQVGNPGFEQATGGVPTLWTPTGTVAQVSSPAPHSGTYCCQLSGIGSGVSQLLPLIRSGDKVQPDCWGEIVSGGAGTTLSYYLQNVYTKNWWTGTAWSSTKTPFATITASSWTNVTTQAPVEPFATCLSDLTALQLSVTLSGGSSPVAVIDDCYLYPAVDTCYVGGHSIDAGVAPQVLTAANGGSAAPVFSTTQLTLVNGQPSFYGLLGSPVYSRWWQFLLPVANQAEAGIAELVLGLSTVWTQEMEYDWSYGPLHDAVDLEARSGEPYVYPYSVWDRRVVNLDFGFYKGLAAFAQVRDEVDRRSRGKGYPLLLIPDDTDTLAFLCRLTNKWTAKRNLVNLWNKASLTFTEQPFPGSQQ